MGDIISIDSKRQSIEDQRTAHLRRRKIYAVRQAMQCAQCHLKCEKCGAHIDFEPEGEAPRHPSLRVPYRFCEFCGQDYVDYIERLQGRGDEACYWQNAAWRDAWARWIEYKGALDGFVKSPAFARLLKDVRSVPE